MRTRRWPQARRRHALGTWLGIGSLTLALVCAHFWPESSPQAQAQELPAIACSGVATSSQTEGPFFKPGSPERASLVDPDSSGTKLVVSGYVLTRNCQPIPGVRLDFWQADGSGRYDNSGFRLRGQQVTDESGRYQLETVVPGEYPGRTPHIHVKVQAPNQPILTTQLYFPGQARNTRDGIFDPSLLLSIQDGGDPVLARFDFVLDQA